MGERGESAGETGTTTLVLARDEEEGGHATAAYRAG